MAVARATERTAAGIALVSNARCGERSRPGRALARHLGTRTVCPGSCCHPGVSCGTASSRTWLDRGIIGVQMTIHVVIQPLAGYGAEVVSPSPGVRQLVAGGEGPPF